MMTQSKSSIVKALWFGLFINLVLTLIKLIAGFLGNSQALVSDGLNSFSDIFISVMLLVVLKVATKKPDHDHPYGHEKYEGLAYFVLGIIFILTATYIFVNSILSIIHSIDNPNEVLAPHRLTILVAIIALSIKIGLYVYYKKISSTFSSPTIKADAKNHLIDAWATLISLIGITLAQFNLIIFDYIASIIIGLFILKLGLQIFFESISYLVDQAPSDEEVKDIKVIINSVSGVIKIDDIKIRKHMTQKYVDVEIGVNSSLSLEEAHKIAENVHHLVEKKFPEVIHCMVHVNPHKQTI
jgi:cation diffusion facilitator family transporter